MRSTGVKTINPLQVVVDEPTASPGLGYEKYVDALSAVIVGGTPARFTIGIYGAWGVGKSSILRAVEARLQGQDLPVVTFDAWRYARNPHVLLPLLAEIEDALDARKDEGFWRSIGRGLRAVTAEVSMSAGGFSLSGAALVNGYDAFQHGPDRRAASVPHARLLEIGDDLAKNDKRIVVLIDDLDRCPPDAIVQVLEAVHVLTDVRGFVFVMALDYAVLISAVTERYATADAALFIEKIIQIPFWIPEIDRSESVIGEIVPRWDDLLVLDENAKQTLHQVVHLALRTNPRQVKRLVNSMLIAQRILGSSSTSAVDNSLLLAVIGLQLNWPDEFKALHRALVSDPDTVHFEDFLGGELEENVDLSAYLTRMFRSDLRAADVLAAMRYSQTAASADGQNDVEPVADGSADLLAQIRSGKHAATFDAICRRLEGEGAVLVPRQQYIAFTYQSKSFLRADAGPRVGVRLFFRTSMTIDAEDIEYFGTATGSRATGFERALVVHNPGAPVVTKYLDRALRAVKDD